MSADRYAPIAMIGMQRLRRASPCFMQTARFTCALPLMIPSLFSFPVLVYKPAGIYCSHNFARASA
jgi:hypothetical protein